MHNEVVTYNASETSNLLAQGNINIKYKIKLDPLTKIQLFLTGRAAKGVEIFRIGMPEIRGMAFLYPFKDLINYAVDNNYKVFVMKSSPVFQKGDWYIKFMLKC